MKIRAGILFATLIGSQLTPLTALAASGDLELVPGSIGFSTPRPSEGHKTRIYATVKSNSKDDLYGVVRFVDTSTGKQVGTDQTVSVFSQRTDDVFVDWVPGAGEHNIKIDLIPWQGGDSTANNSRTISVVVIADQDADGIPDEKDSDIDGDGVANIDDAFPRDPKEWKDTDGDGIGDNADLDDDNDGVPDLDDAFPRDPKESKDTDHDGIGDSTDTDIDGDEISNTIEIQNGTSQTLVDTDNDGAPDNQDGFPLDPKESKDTDHDGIGDSTDTDIDGDSVPNTQDAFPNNIAPVIEAVGLPAMVRINKTIHLDATPSLDPDGKIEKITWIIDEKEVLQGLTADIQLTTPGAHTIELQVTDNHGETKTKKWNLYGTDSVLLAEGGLPSALIALALLGLFYYSTWASRRREKSQKAKNHTN